MISKSNLSGIFSIVAVAGAWMIGVAAAAELPKTSLKVVGMFSHLPEVKEGEKPFWEERVPKLSKGQITVTYTNLDLMGLKGTELLRLLNLGVLDFIGGTISYMAGDEPEFEGVDLAGLADDIGTANRILDAYRPVLENIMEKKYNAKLLALFPSGPQAFWCNYKMTGAADLKGKKVRVFNRSQADLISGFGGVAVTMPFGEATPALERKVIDCGLTGTPSGNAAKWYEITTHMYPMYAGWSINFTAASKKVWDAMDPGVRDFLAQQTADLEKDLRNLIAQRSADALNCTTNTGECRYATKANLTLVPVSGADAAARKKVMADSVVPNWAKRCGQDCTKKWNETIGKVVGIAVPTTP